VTLSPPTETCSLDPYGTAGINGPGQAVYSAGGYDEWDAPALNLCPGVSYKVTFDITIAGCQYYRVATRDANGNYNPRIFLGGYSGGSFQADNIQDVVSLEFTLGCAGYESGTGQITNQVELDELYCTVSFASHSLSLPHSCHVCSHLETLKPKENFLN